MSYPPPTYHGEHGEVSARAVLSTGAPDLTYPNGNRVTYLATGASTGGTYGLYRWEFAGPVSGPGAHFHRTITESFYVLDGRVTLYDGRAWNKYGSGDFVHVPAGGLHGFRNEDGAAAMLLHFAPGATREPYFEGLAQGGVSDMTPQEYDAFMAEHDNIWV